MQLEIYWQIEKEGTYTMHRTSTGWYEWKMRIIWGYRTHKRMSWTIRLAASKNSAHFTIHIRKKNLQSAQNKQTKNN